MSAYRLLASHPNVPEWQSYAIRRLTRQRDLYTTFDGDQEGDDFEKFITREIEEPGQAAIEQLVANRRMKSIDWQRVAKFVAAQQMRTPLFFIEFVKRLNEHIPEALAAVLQRLEEKGATELAADREPSVNTYLEDKLRVTIERGKDPGEPARVSAEVSSSRALWLSTVRHLLTNRMDVVCKHRWRTLMLAGDAEWPLTDHPVLTLNYYGPGRYDFGAGWEKKGSEFILPVSPRIAVFAKVGSKDRGPFHATPAQTKELQRFVIERALRWIIVKTPAPWVVSIRPRFVDPEAYATEQASWMSWNDLHVGDEAKFNAPRTS